MLIINASAPVSLKHRCTSLGFVDWGFLAHPVKWLVHPSTCPSKVHSYWSDFNQTCAQWLPNGCSKCLSTSVLRLSFHGELGELLLGWPCVFCFVFIISALFFVFFLLYWHLYVHSLTAQRLKKSRKCLTRTAVYQKGTRGWLWKCTIKYPKYSMVE